MVQLSAQTLGGGVVKLNLMKSAPVLCALFVAGCGALPAENAYRGEYGCYTGDPPDYIPYSETLTISEAKAAYSLFRSGNYRVTDPAPVGSVCPLSSLRMETIEKADSGLLIGFSDGCGCSSRENLARIASADSRTELQIYSFTGVQESYSVPAEP
jgi:hypothetical protein